MIGVFTVYLSKYPETAIILCCASLFPIWINIDDVLHNYTCRQSDALSQTPQRYEETKIQHAIFLIQEWQTFCYVGCKHYISAVCTKYKYDIDMHLTSDWLSVLPRVCFLTPRPLYIPYQYHTCVYNSHFPFGMMISFAMLCDTICSIAKIAIFFFAIFLILPFKLVFQVLSNVDYLPYILFILCWATWYTPCILWITCKFCPMKN